MKTGLPALRVLIADDNEAARTLLAGILRGVGITQIRQAENGRDAFEGLRHSAPDLAFVDLNMAPVDGIEFTRLVRTAPNSPEPYLPIILLTAAAQIRRIQEARDAGVNEVLVKPAAPKVVVERLRFVIESKRGFVRSDSYVGPDRRRRAAPNYQGPWRREGDPRPKTTAASAG